MKAVKEPGSSRALRVRHRQEINIMLRFLVVLLFCGTWILPAGTQYAVVVGISTFRDLPEHAWLDFAHTDARAYADFLKSRYVRIPPENVTTLLNEDATTVKLKSALGELLKKSTEEDIVYIYIASHGTVDLDLNEAFFVTYDTDPENLYGTAYRMSEFQYITNQVKAKHLIVISDACKSGGIGANIAGSRRDIGEDEVVVNEYFRDILEENEGVGKSQFIYAAAGARESSIEDATMGGGVFTKYLIEALQGAADNNQDGNITAAEAHDYVFNHVRQFTRGRQNPMIVNSAQYDGNLVLAVTDPGAEVGLLLEADAAGTDRDLLVIPPPADPQPVTADSFSSTPDLLSSGATFGFGSLLVESPLEGVEILINGNRTGVLQGQPLLVTLPAGEYRLRAAKADHETLEEPISIQPNQQLNRVIQLRPLFDPQFKDLENKFLDARGIYWDEDPEKAEQLFQEVFETLLEWGQARALNVEEDQYLVDSFIHFTNLQMAGDKGVQTLESWIEKFFTVHILLPGAEEFNEPERYLEVVRKHAVEFIVASEIPEARLTIDHLPEKGIKGEEHFFIKPGRHQIRMSKDNYRPFETVIDFLLYVQYSPLIYEGYLQRLQVLALSEHPLRATVNRLSEVEALPLEPLLS
ncbi:MAG: caspase family protein, partial [Acidobacteria bacterium]|nr:caspase family protein [Acidobacteriota bacterium]